SLWKAWRRSAMILSSGCLIWALDRSGSAFGFVVLTNRQLHHASGHDRFFQRFTANRQKKVPPPRAFGASVGTTGVRQQLILL
ncbi:MAG TPA: hypothetical protein VKY24_06540, partial [Reyranella sp.]|nr:hypothetical protein [Reyranella sp.]